MIHYPGMHLIYAAFLSYKVGPHREAIQCLPASHASSIFRSRDMTIALKIMEDSAVFQYPEGYDGIVQEFDNLLDRGDAGRLSPTRYLAELKDLVRRHPWFIDGHAHLGLALFNQKKPKRALDAYLRGLDLGETVIPSDYPGLIEWRWLENRPFLRAAHGAVCCHLRLSQNRKALALMEKMLGWNPRDNQGIRFLVGSEYLRAGERDKASDLFNALAADYPPYRYELALLLLREGRHPEAATNLRHGFVENCYIAEILCGTPEPLPLAIWHSSTSNKPSLAKDYVWQYGELWNRTPGAVGFLRWLYNHPKVMAERAAVFEWREALLWEHDVERRRMIINKETSSTERIDDRLSAEIVVKRADRSGRMVYPWFYSDMQP